jgi:dCTP deaminase
MILTDREIEACLAAKQIIIDPQPNELAFSSTSLDLTLSKTVYKWKTSANPGIVTEIDPVAGKYAEIASDLLEKEEMVEDGRLLKPGDFLLGSTTERVNLMAEARLAARVEGKSSLARLGLIVHLTAPTIHSGFNGTITLEMCNLGVHNLRIKPGMKICQLIFEQTLGVPHKGYQGQFLNQTPSGAVSSH